MVDLDDGWGDEDEEIQQTIKRKKIEKEAEKQSQGSLSSSDGSLTVPLAPARKRLHGSVADLIRLLFDKEMMKKTMVSLDIDIRKMPLGKISKKQIMQVCFCFLLWVYKFIFLLIFIIRDIPC